MDVPFGEDRYRGSHILMRRSVPLQIGRGPGLMWTVLLLLLATSVSEVQSKVYLVLMNDSPVVHYNGSISGHVATAAVRDTTLDYTSSAVKSYAAYLQTTHDTMLATTFPAGGYKKLYSYTILVNGFAVDIPEEEVGKLAAHPSVMQVEADSRVKPATTHTPEYLGLPGVWAQNGEGRNAGEDIVIGLVDSGVNPTHPSFANDESNPYGPLKSFRGSCEVAKEFPEGSCNYKLIGARHFSAALEVTGTWNSTEYEEFASPLDGTGHGTHTASTAAGNYGVPVEVGGLEFGKASGIAPRARVAVYKVLYREIGGLSSDIVAAIDQAVADGVDILSISISADGDVPDTFPVYFSIIEIALLGAVRAGVFVTQAAGNAGPSTKSVQSFSPWIVSAAASYTDRNYANSITLGNGMTLNGSGLAVGTPGTELYTTVLATDVNITSNPNIAVEACQSSDYFDQKLVQGNLLVCKDNSQFEFGSFTRQAVSETARNLSAAGVIYLGISPSNGQFAIALTTLLTTHQLPAVMLVENVATNFLEYYSASTTKNGDHDQITFGAKVKLNGGTLPTFSGAPPVVAPFSSRGPDYNNISQVPADVLKPNVMAPGVSIWAGWTPIAVNRDSKDFQGEDFAMVSGTSMSTPHIAGIAALVKEKNPTFSPAAIHSALAGTALSLDTSGAPIQAEFPSAETTFKTLGPASPFDMGAGQVNPSAALDPGLVFEAGIDDYTKFLCLIPTATSSEVRNATASGCPSDLSGYPSDLNMPYISIGVLQGSRVVSRTVTSVSKSHEFFTLEIESPANISSTVTPTSFGIDPGQSRQLSLTLTAQMESSDSTFGKLHFHGNRGHHITIPITVSQSTLDLK